MDTKGDRADHTYTCPECGNHKFKVVYERIEEAEGTETIPCNCEAEREFAYQRTYRRWVKLFEWGWLDDDHRVGWVERDEVESDSETLSDETECDPCLEDHQDCPSLEPPDVEEGDPTVDEQSVTWAVLCSECGKEIEFGWSHPERGGRIWPADSADFNPWKSWPEPRFRETWASKGWLRPDSNEGVPDSEASDGETAIPCMQIAEAAATVVRTREIEADDRLCEKGSEEPRRRG